MRSFSNMEVFSAFLLARAEEIRRIQSLGLRDAAEVIQEHARAKLGTYQSASGPFPGWKELADSTKEERKDLGFPENDPLLRTGELRDSIEIVYTAREAVVGVPDREVGDGTPQNELRNIGEVAEVQELGQHGIPPRPFLGPAAFEKAHEAANAVARVVTDALAGKPYRHHKPGSSGEAPPF